MTQRNAFKDLLKRYRKAVSLTQGELADQAKLSERGVSNLERGIRPPRPSTVRLLADALGLVGDERRAFMDAALEPETDRTPCDVSLSPHPGLPV